jgi:integrase
MYRLRCGNPQSGPMFRNTKGKPQELNNILNREILPALKRCSRYRKSLDDHADADHAFKLDESVPKWRGGHAARRGLGSNLYALGVPEKVIQSLLRHANVGTTVTYYVKTRDEQTVQAMEKLENALPEILSVN